LVGGVDRFARDGEVVAAILEIVQSPLQANCRPQSGICGGPAPAYSPRTEILWRKQARPLVGSTGGVGSLCLLVDGSASRRAAVGRAGRHLVWPHRPRRSPRAAAHVGNAGKNRSASETRADAVAAGGSSTLWREPDRYRPARSLFCPGDQGGRSAAELCG